LGPNSRMVRAAKNTRPEKKEEDARQCLRRDAKRGKRVSLERGEWKRSLNENALGKSPVLKKKKKKPKGSKKGH